MGAGVNLLDNWYFSDPINQRGKSTYPPGYLYTIDRWYSARVNLVLMDDGVSISKQEGITYSNGYIQQRMEMSSLAEGVTYTLSVIVDGVLYSGSFVASQSVMGVFSAPWGQADFEYNMYASHRITIRFNGSAKLQAAKLELGDHQTLARQDAGGNWVLNDPPPNKALELAKCQRYFLRLKGFDRDVIGGQARKDCDKVSLYIPTPVTMRANPAVEINGELSFNEVDTTCNWTGTGKAGQNGVSLLNVQVSDPFDTSTEEFVHLLSDSDYVDLSADL